MGSVLMKFSASKNPASELSNTPLLERLHNVLTKVCFGFR